MECPTFAPKITSSHGPILKPNYLPHPWTHLTYGPKLHSYSIGCFATMRWIDRHVDRQMVGGNIRWLMAAIALERAATWPNNSNVVMNLNTHSFSCYPVLRKRYCLFSCMAHGKIISFIDNFTDRLAEWMLILCISKYVTLSVLSFDIVITRNKNYNSNWGLLVTGKWMQWSQLLTQRTSYHTE